MHTTLLPLINTVRVLPADRPTYSESSENVKGDVREPSTDTAMTRDAHDDVDPSVTHSVPLGEEA